MDLTYLVAAVIIFMSCRGFCDPGDPVMYIPGLEVRTLDNRGIPFTNVKFQPESQHLQHPIQHTVATTSSPEKHETKNKNFTFSEFIEALNEVSDHNAEDHTDHSRAAGRDGYNQPPPYPSYPAYPPYSRPYGYSYPRPPSYGPWSPPSYPQPAAYVPPTTVHQSAAKALKSEETGLLKPVTTKVASKISGLIGLVLALMTGSAPDDLELKGFKDIVINGIVKPLLLAKGGIKSLISKLTIPVISLLLINLEVLITIWWLWEECPEPVHSPPVYNYPKPAYNSYR